MHAATLLVAIALSLTATLVQAAGFRFIEVPAGGDGPALNGAMWYPCSEPRAAIELGPYVLSVAKDCSISGDRLPLVVVSHGRGGTYLNFYDLAETLADAGFIVATINHPGDTRSDLSRSGSLSAFVERPAAIRRLVSWMLGASPAASRIDPERVGFFGFSRGGYTGLVLIGGEPDWSSASEFCERTSPSIPLCQQILRKEFLAQPLARDPRIKAAVVADPLAIFFTDASFAAVRIPVQLWASERGGDGVTPESVAVVNRNLRARHEYHMVPNSWHFTFAICSPAMVKAALEICTDAPGFDRAAFHKQFDADVLAFFQAQLRER
jgi:predicted dienelactone hydrolase